MQVGLNVGVNVEGVYVTGGIEAGGCDGLLNEMGGEVPCQSMALEAAISPVLYQTRNSAQVLDLFCLYREHCEGQHG